MSFSNKCLLITGGTGSFGNAVLDRFIDTDLGEIRIFSRDELKQDQMRKKYKNSKLKFYIGDVRDYQSVLNCVRGVDFIFHAAALKQVPSCEFYPLEAVKTNVIGTENVLEAAIASKVKKVVCLSTDKAVYPINAMGISKAMMEKVMVAKARTAAELNTVICGTRYGNVMASRGSVIPLFLRQIFSGLPISITDPSMTRFMMTLGDAVDLVLHAFTHGANGDIFVQKAPAATIDTLVKALLQITDKDNYPVELNATDGEYWKAKGFTLVGEANSERLAGGGRAEHRFEESRVQNQLSFSLAQRILLEDLLVREELVLDDASAVDGAGVDERDGEHRAKR